MAVREVLRMGDPRLLKHAQPVTKFATPELKALLADMQETMQALDGAGLAAPQIGVGLQVVISTVSIYLGYRISVDVWGSRKAALIAAFMLAVHPMLIYYTTFRLTETVFIFLILIGFASIYRDQIGVLNSSRFDHELVAPYFQPAE